MAPPVARNHSHVVTKTPAVLHLATVRQHANACIAIVSQPSSTEARTLLTRLDIVMCLIEADSPLPIDKVESFVAVLLEVIRGGSGLAMPGEAVKEVALSESVNEGETVWT